MRKIIIIGLLFCLIGVSFDVVAQDTTQLSQTLDSLVTSQPAKATKELGQSIIKDGPPSISELISFSKVFWALVFIVIGVLFIKIVSKLLEVLAERSTKYRITIKSYIPVVKIVSWVGIIVIIVGGIFSPPAATILAFSASIGVAVGFASQDILKNIFGGIMILFDRPFMVGDKIEVGNYYGEVVEIGLRYTRVTTPDDNLVSIPNSEIMNSSVSNANAGEPNCQVVAEIYLPIDVDTAKARTLGMQTAAVSRYIYMNKPIVVIFANEFKDRQSLVKMKIKAYVADIRDEFKFKSEMTEIVLKKLLEEKMIKGADQVEA